MMRRAVRAPAIQRTSFFDWYGVALRKLMREADFALRQKPGVKPSTLRGIFMSQRQSGLSQKAVTNNTALFS